jgi:hypothetical protein
MKKIILFTVFCFLLSEICFSQVPYYYYPVPSGTTNNLYDIKKFQYENKYIISGANGTLLRISYPDSSNWISLFSNTSVNINDILNDISYLNLHFALGDNGTILRTTNAGLNWFAQNNSFTNNIYSGTFMTYRYIAVGAIGTIIRRKIIPSSDSVWTPVQSGTNKNLKSIFSRGFYAWIAGANGTILKTVDTGNTWTQLNSGVSNNLNSVWFINISTGFFAGDGGLILKTTNGGANFSVQQSNTTQNLNCIVAVSNADTTNLCIAGNKVILFSSNGGVSWTPDSNVPQYNFYSCQYLPSVMYNTSIPYFVGEYGKIFRKGQDTAYHQNISVKLKANNISSYFSRYGIFDCNRSTGGNIAGFEWPKDSGKTAIYTAGLSIGAYVNGEIREAMCSYSGEYSPGYCVNGNFFRNDYFKIYKVSKSDNALSSWDWLHWGEMVPFGAPFIDVNLNGIYEPAIDTPGVKNAKETIFYCMTDADFWYHNSAEGFGGGTQPLGAEVHMTAWAYDSPGLKDVQFISFDIINKSTNVWNAVKTAIISDPDLGFAVDDYIGCDTTLKLGFCYNADNYDDVYGINPPAVGIAILRSPLNRSISPNAFLGLTNFTSFFGSMVGIQCETDPNGEPYPAYLMLSGLKKDSTCYLDPTHTPYKKTKILYSGDPETNTGWTEYKGRIENCGHDSTGVPQIPVPPSDMRFILGSGADNFNILPGESQKFVIAQLIARGSSNLNSVSVLKYLTATVKTFYENNFPININQVSSTIPDKFELMQNYPNPFNPSTIIRFQIKDSRFVTLKVYDILGKEIETLINGNLKAGIYETQFSGNRLASGVYFYKLAAGDFTTVKRMVLLK